MLAFDEAFRIIIRFEYVGINVGITDGLEESAQTVTDIGRLWADSADDIN